MDFSLFISLLQVFAWSIHLHFPSLSIHVTHPYPSQLPWQECCNNIWQEVQIMKLFTMQFSPSSLYFLPLRFKYLPQHPILTLSHPVFFPPCKRPSILPIYNNMQNKNVYFIAGNVSLIKWIPNKNLLYFSLYIFVEQIWWQKILDQMVPGISWVQSYLNFIMNTIVICYAYSQILELCHTSKGLITHLYVMIPFCVLFTMHECILSLHITYF